jgi:hypothetical protein
VFEGKFSRILRVGATGWEVPAFAKNGMVQKRTQFYAEKEDEERFPSLNIAMQE